MTDFVIRETVNIRQVRRYTVSVPDTCEGCERPIRRCWAEGCDAAHEHVWEKLSFYPGEYVIEDEELIDGGGRDDVDIRLAYANGEVPA